ncbi:MULTISPECIES: hypothetical protein [unclassified Bradyrhizobium]|uniref:hypothetical protein n=1 Tax=unclassified Bradyrhizobium TaxID=2631580 RepID=UPI001FFAED0F|nr:MULTISPECIES: hypothetical protein [unclassified Bradyrhizobium]MCK1615017.1 hypothetical protein [Bradyrhizobium sp. 163]MCK1761733.1 hypothetical protein [Bradyrhizobium sp. 136]
MGFFSSMFSVLSMALTGKVVSQIDTPIMDGSCRLSLRLKRKGDSEYSDGYIVLAGIARGNHQYYAMTADEFMRFAEAVETTRKQLLAVNRM